MSHDLIRKYIVKIELLDEDEKVSVGTGVIFKAHEHSQIFYILTARHTFKNLIINNENRIENVKANIFLERDDNISILKEKITINLLDDSDKDIALIILKKENTNIQHYDIHTIEIFDMDDNPYEKIDFYIRGYPNHMSNIGITKLMSYNLRHSSFIDENDNIANLYCTSSPILVQDKRNIAKEMGGISGAGIFVRKDSSTINLSHIQHDIIDRNMVSAIRVDVLLDDINNIILKENSSFPTIQTSTRVVIDDISIDEFQDFDFLKTKINSELEGNLLKIKEKLNYNIPLDEGEITKEDITKVNKKLKKINSEINLLLKALSGVYVKYAIESKTKSRRLTTLLFKKAIELNPEYKNIFLQEKAARTNNLEKMQEIAASSLEDTINFHDKLIKDNDDNNKEKIFKIKNAIMALMEFKKDDNRDKEIQKFCTLLEKSYKENKTLREPYKYKELGEFYLTIFEDTKALEFLYLAYFILEESPKSEANLLTLEKLKITIEDLENNINNTAEIKQRAQTFAKEILIQEEDSTIKEHLNRSNKMLETVYDDIYQIKQEESKRNKTIIDLQNTIQTLKTKIEIQIQQNTSHNIDTTSVNMSISKLDVLNDILSQQISNIQDKYEIQLDDKTRNELRGIIEEPVATINSTLEEINQTSKQTREHIDHSEKSLNYLVEDGLKQLTELAKQSKENLENISKYQSKLNSEKDELLIFIRRFEVRIKKSIDHLCDCRNERNNVIGLIQQSINNLAKQLKNLNFTQTDRTDEKFYYIQQRNMASIQHSCLDLENKIIEKLEEIQQNRNGSTVETTEEKDNDLFIDLIKETQSFIQSNNQHLQKLINKESISIKTSQTKIQNDLNDIKNRIAHQSGKTENIIKTSIHDARQLLSKQLASNNAKIDSAGNGVVNKILTHTKDDKTEIISHLQNTDYRLQRINNTQLRFEKNLLEKTKEALDVQQYIDFSDNVRMPLSLTRKILLGICITIFISAITYFIINYRLLDLPLDLWQTALQKINS